MRSMLKVLGFFLVMNAVFLGLGGGVSYLIRLVLPDMDVGSAWTVAMITVVGSVIVMGHMLVTASVVENRRASGDPSEDDEPVADAMLDELADRISYRVSKARVRGRRR